MHTAFLLTGSNIGSAIEHLTRAAHEISEHAGEIIHRSGFYRTAPWGNTNQAAFLNEVLQVETNIEPRALLNMLLAIESRMGRVRTEKWAPRVIDIDILFYDDVILEEPGLQIPHPYLHERRFTLGPLAAIAPAQVHPRFQRTVAELLVACPDHSEVEKL